MAERSFPRALAALVLTLAPGAMAEPRPESEPPAVGDPGFRREPEASWSVPVLHGLGLMTAMRVGEAVIWPEPFADTNLSHIGRHYRRAYTEAPVWDSSQRAFEWDGDRWWINVFGHALFGSELYLRVRTCKHGVLPALAFAAAGSALWEYGFEANGVRPSGLDLWYTPAAGLVLGEARYLGWTAARGLRDPTARNVLSAIFDPFGELERAAGTGC